MSTNKSMKVFSKLYVGYQRQAIRHWNEATKKWDTAACDVPLGFATPYEDNAAGRKRQQTVNGWAGKDQVPTIIDNEPAEGFKITDDIKRTYYGGGNVVFRVYDPRGFELEIQSQNLMTLISLVGLNAGGEIPGKCLWGRDGPNNILIHESSEEYKTARLAAETIKPLSGVGKSSYKPGNRVQLTNGNSGTYLGRFWLFGHKSIEVLQPELQLAINTKIATRMVSSQATADTLVGPTQFYVFQEDADRGVATSLLLYRELKVEKVLNDEVMTEQDALSLINGGRGDRRISTAGSVHAYWAKASVKKQQVFWSFEPASREYFDILISKLQERYCHGNGQNHLHIYTGDHAFSPLTWVIKDGERFYCADSSDKWHAYSALNPHVHYASSPQQYLESPVLTQYVRAVDDVLFKFTIKRQNSYYHRNGRGVQPPLDEKEAPLVLIDNVNTKQDAENWLTEKFNAGLLYVVVPKLKD